MSKPALYKKDMWTVGARRYTRSINRAIELGCTGVSFMMTKEGSRGIHWHPVNSQVSVDDFQGAIKLCKDSGLDCTLTIWLRGDDTDQIRLFAEEIKRWPLKPTFIELDLEGIFRHAIKRYPGGVDGFIADLDKYFKPLDIPILVTTLAYGPKAAVKVALWAVNETGGAVRPQAYSVVTDKGHGRTAGERPGVLQPRTIDKYVKLGFPKNRIWLGVSAFGKPIPPNTAEQSLEKQIDSTIATGVRSIAFWSEAGSFGSGDRKKQFREVLKSYPIKTNIVPFFKAGGVGESRLQSRIKTGLKVAIGAALVAGIGKVIVAARNGNTFNKARARVRKNFKG